jgi:hypothetical protein
MSRRISLLIAAPVPGIAVPVVQLLPVVLHVGLEFQHMIDVDLTSLASSGREETGFFVVMAANGVDSYVG